jgi:hypothetical protein
MTIPYFTIEKFNPARVANDRLFSRSFDEDPWVVFHGTSVSNSEAIEREGFTFDRHSLTQADINRIKEVFLAMRWAGNDPGGYPVLSGFSSNDFIAESWSPIFFTERPTRALLYATREFAGGEKFRAVRRAIQSLKQYLCDEGVRAQHNSEMEQAFAFLTEVGAAADQIESARPKPIDLHWLEKTLDSLQPISDLATRAVTSFSGGVVYGVRVEEANLSSLTYCPQMGIKARSLMPPRQIICKMEIPKDYVHDSFASTDIDLMIKKMNSGVLQRLCPSRNGQSF